MANTTGKSGIDPPARLHIHLLGVVEAIMDGHRLRPLESPRIQRFLARIVLSTGALRRSRLAVALWPESTDGQARTNLRKLLHEFRQGLTDSEAFVEINNETVRWLPDSPSQVDVLEFRDAVAAGNLELAARLYSGDLLPACYDDWVLRERQKLRAEALGAIAWLTEEAARRDDHKATLRHAARTLELDATDETAVRFQMQAHHALGDRAAALRAYHRYAEVLEGELAVAPGGAVESLYQTFRAESPSHPHRDLIPIVDNTLIGRDREWNKLNEAWNRACAGHAHLVLVTGEPGIGKSRLAFELRRRAESDGHLVAWAQAYEAAGRLPWGPVVELLRADPLQSHIDSLPATWKTELARLLPERWAPADTANTGAVPPVAQRHRLFDAVGRALVSMDRPRLLIIDDLQWCDAETIELIGFIVRSKQSAPVLIVGTVRSEEVSDDHPLVALTNALELAQAVSTIPLGRLDEEATTALARRLNGTGTLPPKLIKRIWTETEGNPLFIVEVLRTGISGDEAVLTPTMRAVLRARLTQLTDGARRLASMAAVFGRPFSTELMARATGNDERDIVDHMDELWCRRIIHDRGLHYDFTHDKLRAVAVEMVNPARRRLLHKSIAEAMTEAAPDGVEPVSAQVATHFDQAGLVQQAIDAYHVAGTQAVSLSGLQEAVAMFERALSLLAELPTSPSRHRLELDIRIALGAPRVALDGYGSKAAHQLYERALSLCHSLERPVDAPILRGLALARLQGCRFEDCRSLAQELLDEQRDDPVAKTEGRYLLGVSAFWQGDLSTAHETLNRAIHGYDRAHSHAHLSRFAQDPKAVCLVRRALVEHWMGDADQATQTSRSALEYAADLDHLMTSAYVLTYASILAAEAEDYERLTELLAEADTLWSRAPIGYLRYVLDALRSTLEVRNGNLAGIEEIAQCVTRSRPAGENLHLTYTLLLLARARELAGEVPQARAAIRDALAWTERCSQGYLEAELWRMDGELAYQAGESSTAAASLRQAVDVAAGQGAHWLGVRAAHAWARRFPSRVSRERLATLLDGIRSGHDLPAFRAAREFLSA